MGAFNRLLTTVACPRCGGETTLAIQFKYGDTWQYDYRLGDSLRWGGNDVGKPGQRRVVVDGIAESCAMCGASFPVEDYEILIEGDKIVSVKPATGSYDFAVIGENYIVLD